MEMENFKTLLNKRNEKYEFVKLDSLEQEKKYEITFFEYINTKKGTTITVVLENKIRVFLPNSFNDDITDENILFYNKHSKTNTKLKLIYKGMKKINNGKSMHLIDFE